MIYPSHLSQMANFLRASKDTDVLQSVTFPSQSVTERKNMEKILKYRLERNLSRREMCDLLYEKVNYIINPRDLKSRESGRRPLTENEQHLIDRYFVDGKAWYES